MPVTVLSDLLYQPQVARDLIEAYFRRRLTLGKYAARVNDLAGKPGETITFPFIGKLGAAEEPLEGAALAVDNVTSDKFTAAVKEVGKAAGFSDSALMRGGQPIVDLGLQQIGQVIAEKIDADLFSEAYAAGNTASGFTASASADTLSMSVILDALVSAFGDRLHEARTLVLHSKQFADLVKANDGYLSAANRTTDVVQTEGLIGRDFGMDVVVSDSVPVTTDGVTTGVDSYDALALKENALAFIVKKDFGEVERDRDILARETRYSTTVWYAVKSMHAKAAADDLRACLIRTA